MRSSPSLVLLPFVLAACGGGAAVPTLDTGLPRDTPADQVTPAEAQTSCQAYENVANQSLGIDVQRSVGCTLAGIASQLGGGTSCASTTTTCLADTTAGVAIDFQCANAVSFAPSGCTATIGELEDCVNAVASDIHAFTSAVNCSLATDPDSLVRLAQLASAISKPASNPACVNLPAECIGLLGWTADATPVVPGM